MGDETDAVAQGIDLGLLRHEDALVLDGRPRPASVPCVITASRPATADPSEAVSTGETVGNTTLCATTGIGAPPGTEHPCPMRTALSAVTPSVACDRTVVCATASPSVARRTVTAQAKALVESRVFRISRAVSCLRSGR